jgi:hypothetical protein
MEHDRNEVPDLISDFLLCKFERLGGRSSEGSAQEDHRLNMGIDHILCTRFVGFLNVLGEHIPHFLRQSSNGPSWSTLYTPLYRYQ